MVRAGEEGCLKKKEEDVRKVSSCTHYGNCHDAGFRTARGCGRRKEKPREVRMNRGTCRVHLAGAV